MSKIFHDKEFQKVLWFYGGAFLLVIVAISITPGGWQSLITDMNALLATFVAAAGLFFGGKVAFPWAANRINPIVAFLAVFAICIVLPFVIVLALGGNL